MSLLLACLLLHYFSQGFGFLWWAPDFVIVGLVLATAKSPRRWMFFACVTACIFLIWAVRFHGLLVAGFFSLGFLVSLATKRWDFNDRRVLFGFMGSSALVFNSIMVWSDNLWSWGILGLLLFRVSVTLLFVGCIYPLWQWLVD